MSCSQDSELGRPKSTWDSRVPIGEHSRENEKAPSVPRAATDIPFLLMHRPASTSRAASKRSELVESLSTLDRMLAFLVLIAMVLEIVIGTYAPGIQNASSDSELAGTSVPECTRLTWVT